jgi:PTH2 family peptidyl-tRNA hydrolase
LSEFKIKQVIVVRQDLQMGKGKLAAQTAHAAVSAAERVRRSRLEWYQEWVESGQAKVVVKVNSLDDLLDVKARCETESLPTYLVQDRGLTQIPSGTITCLGIGPAPSAKIDKITGHLKLL